MFLAPGVQGTDERGEALASAAEGVLDSCTLYLTKPLYFDKVAI